MGVDPAVDLAAGAREVAGERAHAAAELLELVGSRDGARRRCSLLA
jgi:hypothetical protein